MGTTTVDERGRVTIPQREREKAGVRPGARVRVHATDNAIIIRRTASREDFSEIFAGCITGEKAVGEAMDPLRVKEMWRLASR